MSLRSFIDSNIRDRMSTGFGALVNNLDKLARKDDFNGSVIRTGRHNTQSGLDVVEADVLMVNGEVQTKFVGTRTVRPGDPVVAVGNRLI